MQFLILIRAQRKRCSYEGSIDSMEEYDLVDRVVLRKT